MNWRPLIPNAITVGNLACGFLAILLALNGHLHVAGLFIIVGAALDFLDGAAAKMLDAKSTIGGQLDSLADMVTFGIAPGIIAYTMMVSLPFLQESFYTSFMAVGPETHQYGGAEMWYFKRYFMWSSTELQGQFFGSMPFSPIDGLWMGPKLVGEIDVTAFLIAALFPLAAALRLALFNSSDSVKDFSGLPTPAAALCMAALPILLVRELVLEQDQVFSQVNRTSIVLLVLLLAGLMLVRIKMFSLKSLGQGWTQNKIQYVFLGLCAVLIIGALLKNNVWLSIPIIVLLYILLSLVNSFVSKDEIQS